MTREVLSNGVIVPEKYTRDWFDDFRTNLVKLNDAITAIAGKQNALTQEQLNAVNSAITAQKVTDYDSHIADTSKHLTDGTAPKAIADEDGTNIKTGYGKLAGANTWTQDQTTTASYYIKSTTWERGVEPSSSSHKDIYFTDKNNAVVGAIRRQIANGTQQIEVFGSAPVKNGQLDPTGTLSIWGFNQTFLSDGTTYFSFNGYIGNSVTPRTNNYYDLGTSANQWKSVYAQTYYYNGTAWGLDKSNTWSGNNEYKYLIGLSGSEIWFKQQNIEYITANPDTNISKSIIQIYNKAVTQYSGGITDSLLTDGTHRISISCFGFPLNNYGGYYPHSFSFEAKRDGTASFSPTYTNASLGTSSNKWKTLNGINPGALSLPDYANYVDITSSMSSATLDGTTPIDINDYLPNMTGWLNVVIAEATGDYIFATQGKSGTASGFNTSRSFHAGVSAYGYTVLFMPIVAGSWHSLFVKASSLTQVRFYPCLGNV